MTMPDLFEQLDSPAENGDDWIRRLLSEPDETPSPTPAAGDDGTDTGHEPDLPQEEERIVPPQASGPGAGGDVTAPPPPGAHAIPLPASDDTSPSDDLDDMHQDAIPGFGTDMDADEPARSVHAGRIVLTVLAVVTAVALVGVIAAGAVTAARFIAGVRAPRRGTGAGRAAGDQYDCDSVRQSPQGVRPRRREGMEPSGRADFGQREDTRRARRPAVHQGCWIVEGPRGQGQ